MWKDGSVMVRLPVPPLQSCFWFPMPFSILQADALRLFSPFLQPLPSPRQSPHSPPPELPCPPARLSQIPLSATLTIYISISINIKGPFSGKCTALYGRDTENTSCYSLNPGYQNKTSLNLKRVGQRETEQSSTLPAPNFILLQPPFQLHREQSQI